MSDKTVNVMDQFAYARSVSASEVTQTPMHHVADAVNSGGKVAASSVSLSEAPLTGVLILRANDSMGALSEALKKSAGVTLPDTLASDESGDYCARWMTPDEWLLTCPNSEAFDLEQSLRAEVDGHIAIVNNTGGYSIMTLSGNDARNVLKKSTVYDVSSENFQPGKVVNTTLAKAQVTLRALTNDSFEIIVRRSFADYVWLWLQRAGREYTMQFSVEGS